MASRTEEQKLVQAPVKVVLGGVEYEVKPLPIKYSMGWVKKIAQMSIELLNVTKLESADEDVIKSTLTQIMADDPAKLVDYFFEYARDLKREEIEEVATSAEIVAAFEAVMEIERPLLQMAVSVAGKAIPTSR